MAPALFIVMLKCVRLCVHVQEQGNRKRIASVNNLVSLLHTRTCDLKKKKKKRRGMENRTGKGRGRKCDVTFEELHW